MSEHNWIATLISNPVKVAVAVLLVMLFGLITLFTIPVQLTPEVQSPVVSVFTIWPGASPQEVEREIIQEQEEQLKQVEGVRRMSSECYHSAGRIVLEFEVGTNMTEAMLRVAIQLQQVIDYPEDALEPVIYTSGLSDRPIAWFVLGPKLPSREEIEAAKRRFPALADRLDKVLAITNPEIGLMRLERLAADHPEVAYLLPPPVDITQLRKFVEDVIEARLERVPGVANANVFGGRFREFQVRVSPERLAAHRLTITDLRNALRAENRDTSAGDFWEGKRTYVVRTVGQFRTPEDVANVIVAYRNGVPVYVRDVATVGIGYGKPGGIARRFGRENIAINVERTTGANVLEVMEELRAVQEQLNKFVLHPRGLHLTMVYDETEYINSALGLVTNNLYLAIILTVTVLLLFLRSARSTLVLALAIPVSVLGAFLVLGLLGRTLNVISLAGLAFAIGMLVDNAVVVLENIYRHRQAGLPARAAAVKGTSEVWGAVLSSTLTTLAVFLPVLFVKEEAGQLFRDIAIAISSAVALSLVVGVTVIPTASARLLAASSPTDMPVGRDGQLRAVRALVGVAAAVLARFTQPLYFIGEQFVRAIVGLNRWLLGRVWRRLLALSLALGVSIGLSYLLFPQLEYLPAGNRNLVIGVLLPPPGYNLAELLKMGEKVEETLRPYWDVDITDPAVFEREYPPISDFFFVARGRTAFFGVRSADPTRARELVDLVQRTVNMFPGTIGIASQTSLFERGLAGRNIAVEVTGRDLNELFAVAGRIMAELQREMPGVRAIPSPGLEVANPEVHVVPNRIRLAELGLTTASLGYTVDAMIDGAYADDYFVGGEKINLRILGPTVYEGNTQDLAQLPIVTPTGQIVPLGAVAQIRLTTGPEQINRRERQRAVTINVTPPDEMALEEAMRRIEDGIVRKLEREGLVGERVQVYLSGTADKLRQTWRATRFNFLLALVITYLLMAGLFESWLYPFVVILTVPLGAVGGIVGLRLVNLFTPQPLDVLTMLGFIILVGTAVNNAILIVHQSLNHIRREGMPWRDAILESVRNRIRPIFMTTFTTVFGLLPLVVFPGAGSELYRGLGAVVLGGLLVSAFLTLLVTPTMLSLAWQLRDGLAARFDRRPPQEMPEPVRARLQKGARV